MKSAFRWTALLLLLCSALLLPGAVFAEDRRLDLEGGITAGRPADRERAMPLSNRAAVILDGVTFAAGEFKRPSGPLTWVTTREDIENGTVHGFTAHESAEAFMRQVVDRQFGKAICESHGAPYSRFNKDVGCGGSGHLFLYPYDDYEDLDFDGWNNRISCVFSGCVDAWTTLYSCRNFQLSEGWNCDNPDVHFIEPGQIITDLNTVNFNNMTSSIRFCMFGSPCPQQPPNP